MNCSQSMNYFTILLGVLCVVLIIVNGNRYTRWKREQEKNDREQL